MMQLNSDTGDWKPSRAPPCMEVMVDNIRQQSNQYQFCAFWATSWGQRKHDDPSVFIPELMLKIERCNDLILYTCEFRSEWWRSGFLFQRYRLVMTTMRRLINLGTFLVEPRKHACRGPIIMISTRRVWKYPYMVVYNLRWFIHQDPFSSSSIAVVVVVVVVVVVGSRK